MSLLVELDKSDLIRLCMSLPVGHTYAQSEYWVQLGAAKFTGNQHNEHWSWIRGYFTKFAEQQLVTFYNNNK